MINTNIVNKCKFEKFLLKRMEKRRSEDLELFHELSESYDLDKKATTDFGKIISSSRADEREAAMRNVMVMLRSNEDLIDRMHRTIESLVKQQ